jgi:hypothetical protein
MNANEKVMAAVVGIAVVGTIIYFATRPPALGTVATTTLTNGHRYRMDVTGQAQPANATVTSMQTTLDQAIGTSMAGVVSVTPLGNGSSTTFDYKGPTGPVPAALASLPGGVSVLFYDLGVTP